MTIAFVVSRTPQYRLYGPIIEAALARGWTVECWHDHQQPQTGLKGYQFPSIESVPVFLHGRPGVRSFEGRAGLRTWLTTLQADVVISTDAPSEAVGLPLPAPRPFWVKLQFLFESFVRGGPEQILTCDRIALYSRWWLAWAADHFASNGLLDDRDAFLRDADTRAAVVGLPELDSVARVDPVEVRRRWGIPPNQPVVVLLPFPQGVGWSGFWARELFAEPSRLKQLVNIAVRREFGFLPHVRHGWTDRNVLRALRTFCDRNGAFLLIKSRLKTPVPAYASALADNCIYDEGYYPATVVEALSVASLSVSYYSNTVFESVGLGVPHLCLTYDLQDYLGPDHPGFLSTYYTPHEGGPFQFRGASTAWTIPEALRRLPTQTLADFAIDEAARSRYVEKFLSHTNEDGGLRTIEAIERALPHSLSGVATPT